MNFGPVIVSSYNDPNDVPVFLLTGEPGVGKSYFVRNVVPDILKVYLGITDIEQHELLCNEGSGKEEFIYSPILSTIIRGVSNRLKAEDSDQVIMPSVLIQAMANSMDKSKPVQVVLIDEIDKSDPAVDTFLLPIFEEGIIKDQVVLLTIKELTGLDNIEVDKSRFFVFITSNGQRKLNDALIRRMVHLDFLFPCQNETISRIRIKKPYLFESLGENKIKGIISILYNTRNFTSHKMVQNEMERVIEFIYSLKSKKDLYSQEEIKDSFRAIIATNESDRQKVDNEYSLKNLLNSWTKY